MKFTLKTLLMLVAIIAAYFGGYHSARDEERQAVRAFRIMEKWAGRPIAHYGWADIQTDKAGSFRMQHYAMWTAEFIVSPEGDERGWIHGKTHDNPIEAVIEGEKEMLKHVKGNFQGY